jgi:hypothetical protein
MKTRKSISAFACLTILIVCIASFCFTGCSKGVRINEKNFPDEAFRNYLIKKDHDGDNYYSADQMAFIYGFELTGCKNLEGIEHFESLWHLKLTNCEDISAIESVSKLRDLTLVDCKNVDIDFSKLVNLQKLTITNSNVTVNIDLSDSQNITDIKIEDSTIKNVTLNNCAVLNKVYLHRTTAYTVKMNNCPLFQSFTADEVQDLKSVEITECPKMGGAYFSDCPELCELALRECTVLSKLSIYDCDGVKEVDVRGCKYIWEVFNTPDALASMEKSARPGYVILYTSDDDKLMALQLPSIRIECLPDVEFITR